MDSSCSDTWRASRAPCGGSDGSPRSSYVATIVALIRAFDDVGTAGLSAAAKQARLSRGIAEAMRFTAASAVVFLVAFVVLVALQLRLRSQRALARGGERS